MEEAEINLWLRKLKEAMAISEFHFRDAVIDLIERTEDEDANSDEDFS